jgi:hypothetical protein
VESTGREEGLVVGFCGHSNILYYLAVAWRAVAWWLRHYATNRQVAGPIPDGVIGIFQ